MLVGSATRLVLFVMRPTAFGLNNALLYIPNDIFSSDFDGLPTLLSPLLGFVVFVAVSLLTYREPSRRAQGLF